MGLLCWELCSPKSHMGVLSPGTCESNLTGEHIQLRWEGETWIQTYARWSHRVGRPREAGQRGRGDAATSPGTTRGTTRAGGDGTGTFPEPPEGAEPCCHLDFQLLASRTGRELMAIIISHPVWGNFVLAATGNDILAFRPFKIDWESKGRSIPFCFLLCQMTLLSQVRLRYYVITLNIHSRVWLPPLCPRCSQHCTWPGLRFPVKMPSFCISNIWCKEASNGSFLFKKNKWDNTDI